VNVVSIGEVLWDIVGEQEYLGGASFNFSAHLTKLGHAVSFISAVGADPRGRKILQRMDELGVSDRYLRSALFAGGQYFEADALENKSRRLESA